MGNRPTFQSPVGAVQPELVVDKILRTSYDVVKYVAEHMADILALNAQGEDITAIVPFLENIKTAAESITAVNTVATNIAHIETVNENIQAIIDISTSSEYLGVIGENIDKIVILANNIDDINNVAQHMDDINTIMSHLDEILEAREFTSENVTKSEDARDRAEAAKQASEQIQNTLLDDINAVAVPLAQGEDPTADYNPVNKRITLGMPAAPVNRLDIGTVVRGEEADASITGSTPEQVLNLTLPVGDKGNNAWVPVLANVDDAGRVVQRVVDWTNGNGPKPAVGLYVGSEGLTSDITVATNIRGGSGEGSGDMLADTYDPNGVAGDAFSMTNMMEGTEKKIFSATERAKLNAIAAEATKNATDAQLRNRTTHTGAQPMSSITGLATALDAKQSVSAKGQPNGYASLDSNGKVPISETNEALLGAMNYQGVWDAFTNTPGIPPATAANKGYYRIVEVAGATNIDGETAWAVGDWIVSNGVTWDKIDSSDQVTSVNGQIGAVVLDKEDVGLGNVANKSEAQMVASGAIKDALDQRATSAQGTKADSAVQPNMIGTAATANFHYGTGIPANDFGNNGDVYFRYDA